MKKWIIVKTDFIGFHCWPDAPTEVGFLRHTHRHLFKVRLWLEVTSSDRELEFFILQKKLKAFIKHALFDPNASCEMMAETILEYFSNRWGKRACKVEVFEDGENGAVVESE